VVVNSSCNSHSCNTYHPAERRLSAVNPRDAAGTQHEMGPCGPSSRIPTAFGGMGPEGEPPNDGPNDTGHHYHDEHDGTVHFAGPTMLLGPHWSSSGIINNLNGGLSTSQTASGMTITSSGWTSTKSVLSLVPVPVMAKDCPVIISIQYL
jgi:hypothetical protein